MRLICVALGFACVGVAQRPFAQSPAVAFVQNRALWVRELPDGAAQQLTSTLSSKANPSAPSFSADGAYVAFLDADQLAIVAASGGDVVRPAAAQGDVTFRWSPKGHTLAISTRDALWIASDAVRWVPSVVIPERVYSTIFNSDGAKLAFCVDEVAPTGEPLKMRVEIVDLETHAQPREILSRPAEMDLFSWTGDTIFFWLGEEFSASAASDGLDFFAIPASGGEPRKMAGPALLFDPLERISPDGKTIAMTVGGSRQSWTNKRISTLDIATGKVLSTTKSGDAALWPAWSPSGESIAYVAAPDPGDVWGGNPAEEAMRKRHIWLMARDGSQVRQLTSDPKYRDERPFWSADGKSILFCRFDESEVASLWWISVSGGEAKQIAGPISLGGEDGWFSNYGYVDWDGSIDFWPGTAR